MRWGPSDSLPERALSWFSDRGLGPPRFVCDMGTTAMCLTSTCVRWRACDARTMISALAILHWLKEAQSI
jgi:hypothetical protein